MLLAAVRAGNRLSVSARFAGVSPKTLSEWMRRGRGVDGRSAVEPYVGFVRDVEGAQAEAEVYALAMIRKAMTNDWRAAAWYLENVDPAWRRRKLPPVAEKISLPPAPPVQGTILVKGETIRRIQDELRAEKAEADIHDATRARLVPGDD